MKIINYMVNSSLEKFSSFLQAEDIKTAQQLAEQKQEKEIVRQAKMKGLKEELPGLTTEYGDAENEQQRTGKNINSLLSERKLVKEDGRKTLTKAKEVGKVDLLRQKAKEFFAENISKLKDINVNFIDNKQSSKNSRERLDKLGQEISQKKEELTRLENEPVTEKIQELEAEFNNMVAEYNSLDSSLTEKYDVIKSLGIRKDGDGKMGAWGDGWGASPEFVSNRQKFDSKEIAKSEKERTPIHKALDKVVESLPSHIQERLGGNNNSYGALENALLAKTDSPEEEKNLLSRLQSDYSLWGVDVSEVRVVVAEYQKLQEDCQKIQSDKDSLWQKIGEMRERQGKEEKNVSYRESDFNATQNSLVTAEKKLEDNLGMIKRYDDDLKQIAVEKEALLTTARQMETNFRQKMSGLTKYNVEIGEHPLANPKLEMEKLSVFLDKTRKEISQKETEVRNLESKKIVLNKKGKTEELNKEIDILKSQEKEVVDIWEDLNRTAYYSYQEVLKQIEDKGRNLTYADRGAKYNSQEIERLKKAIPELKDKIKKSEEELILAKAWAQAKFEKN